MNANEHAFAVVGPDLGRGPFVAHGPGEATSKLGPYELRATVFETYVSMRVHSWFNGSTP
jgi:hypothetical protein